MYYQNNFQREPTKDFSFFLSLIVEVVRHEAYSELIFDYLKVIAPNKDDEGFLQIMLDDEREHYRDLKKIYFSLTGQHALGDAPQFEVPETYIGGLDNIYLKKLEILSIYKRMRNFSPYINIREKIYEFSQDELKHLTILNRIIIKQFMKERVHDYPAYPIFQASLFS